MKIKISTNGVEINNVFVGDDKMEPIRTICPNPGCDKDITLDPGRILKAVLRKKQTNGKALIECPLCCHVMVLPDEIPTNMVMFEQYINDLEKNNGYLGDCVPMIDPTMIRMPTGSRVIHGSTLYSSGTGELLDKYAYMVKYGINPECAKYDSGIKPLVVGRAGKK